MGEETPDTLVPDESWDEVTTSTFYDVVGHTERSALVAALDESDEALALSEVAEEVASRTNEQVDGPLTPDEIKKTRLLLYHKHLPILTDGGVVDFDEDDETVIITAKGTEIAEARDRIAEQDPIDPKGQ